MLLTPRYDEPVVASIDGAPGDQLVPVVRQRRRMESMLAGLADEHWRAPSRCTDWTVRDVVAHLVDVNGFWHFSIISGLAGTPTRMLSGFDPVTSPPALVGMQGDMSPADALAKFVDSNDRFLGVLAELDDDGWSTLAEAPAGHLPVRVLAHHALWDAWVHERDIVLPLGIPPTLEDDELRSCLRFAAVISPALGLGLGAAAPGSYVVDAVRPDERFSLDVDTSVSVRAADDVTDRACLAGDTVELIEALSLRGPLPPGTPPEWLQLLGGLATAFDALP